MNRNWIFSAASAAILFSTIVGYFSAKDSANQRLEAALSTGLTGVSRIEQQVRDAWLDQPIDRQICQAELTKAHNDSIQALKRVVSAPLDPRARKWVFSGYASSALYTARAGVGRKRTNENKTIVLSKMEVAPVIAEEERKFLTTIDRSMAPYGAWLVYSIFALGVAVWLIWMKNAPERRAKRAAQQKLHIDAQYAALRANPLRDHHCCPQCGWLGRFRCPDGGPSGMGGTAAVAGGTAITGFGLVGVIGGIVLVLVGIPLLLFFGLGIIPITIGGILIALGSTATTAGVTVGVAGAESVSRANQIRQSMANAPQVCPACRNPGLIPATSPIALDMIQSNPHFASAANSKIDEVRGQICVCPSKSETISCSIEK